MDDEPISLLAPRIYVFKQKGEPVKFGRIREIHLGTLYLDYYSLNGDFSSSDEVDPIGFLKGYIDPFNVSVAMQELGRVPIESRLGEVIRVGCVSHSR